MARNLIDAGKAYIRYYYFNGEWINTPNFKYAGKVVSEDSKEFLSEFFHFLIESSFLNDITKMWLNSNLGSMRAAIEDMNSQLDDLDQITVHAGESAIDYDKKKLLRKFNNDKDLYDNVLAYPEKYIPVYREILDILQREYMKDRGYNKALLVKLDPHVIVKETSDDNWETLKNILSTYSKKTVDKINSGDMENYNEVCGYYNYLISNKHLKEKDKQRLEEVKDILGIGEEE